MPAKCRNIRHLTVFAAEGKFAGWPANSGLWSWGRELLCGFALADHLEKKGHTYDSAGARQKFARSHDAGETWMLEDAFERGMTARAKDHSPGSQAVPPRQCPGGPDFTAPGFAAAFRRTDDASGSSHFYFTGDRGLSWQGPYALPEMGHPGILARTDYLVEGRKSLLAMMTISKKNGREGRVGCARTSDGGRSWQWVAWLDEEPGGFAIMPATVRLPGGRLLCVVRRREDDRNWLAAYASDDKAATWRRLPDPVPDTGRGGNPPALVGLGDGSLCLAYAVRSRGPDDPSRICVRFSSDGGENWSGENIIRGNDGANWDIGYPVITLLPDGRLVVIYYYNHAWRVKPSYRYIAATFFEPVLLHDRQ